MAIEHPTEASFLKDVAQHQINIIRDDGVHRHIQFKKPGSWCYHFDIITWPGYLAYSGDMGSFVFQRLEDMLQFFRCDRDNMRLRDGQTLAINPGYWSEKLVAVDRSGGYKEYSKDRFIQLVEERRVEMIRETAREQTLTKEQRRELWEAIDNEVLGAADDGEQGAHEAARDFEFDAIVRGRNRRVGLGDFWEHDLTDYTYHFMWCCYALAWAVLKYDEAKTPAIKEAA